MKMKKITLSLITSSCLCLANSTQTFAFHQGWNLVGVGLDNVSLNDFNSTKVIWQYKNGWNIYSPSMQSSYPSITSLSSGDGIWVYANEDSYLSISGDTPSSQQVSATPNEWNLISPKTVDSSFSMLPIIENNGTIAWSWDKGTWRAFSPNESMMRKITALGYETFDGVKAGEGFWVHPSTSPIVFNKFNDDVNAIIKTDSVADVAKAKNLIKEVRATLAKTYNDGSNPDFVSAYKNQSDLISSKIVPAIEDLTNDIDNSFTVADSMVTSFGEDVNGSFQTITNEFSNRVNQWIDVIDANETDVITSYADTVTYTSNIFKVTGTNANIEVALNKENGETGTNLVNGSLSGNGYSMNITKLNYNLSTKQVEIVANVHFFNTSSNDINATLSANWVYDKNSSALDAGKNISFAFDGDIKTGGRIFNGKIRFSDADTTLNYISGKLIGKSGEPTLEGKFGMNSDLSLLKKMSSEEGDEVHWGEAFFAQNSDGTNSVILSSSPSLANNQTFGSGLESGNYTFTTLANSTLPTSCNSVNHSGDGTVLECSNGLTIKHIIYHNNSNLTMEAIVDGETKSLNDSYTNQYDDVYTTTFSLANKDGDYSKHSNLIYDHNTKQFQLEVCDYSSYTSSCFKNNVTVSNIFYRLLDNPQTLPLSAFMSLSLKDGIKEVSFDLSANRDPEEKNWKGRLSNIKYIKGEDGITIDEIKVVLQDLDAKNSAIFWDESNIVSHANFINIKGDITGIDSNRLSVDVNMSIDKIIELGSLAFSDFAPNTWYGFQNDNINIRNIIKLNGHYQYANSTFQGSVLLDQREVGTATAGSNCPNNYSCYPYAYKNTEMVTTNSRIDGQFGFAGYAPYNLSARISQNGAKFILTEPTGYKLAGKYNSDTKEFNFGDTNGVRMNGTTSNFSMKDKNGVSLGTFGKLSNGNNWEITYSDNSTETLF